jgi:hypothetical protein
VSVSDVDAEKMGSVAQWRNVPADIGDGGRRMFVGGVYGSGLKEESKVHGSDCRCRERGEPGSAVLG